MSTMSFPSVGAGSLILILGLGETGLAAARWCLRNGARLRVLDTRAQPAAAAVLQGEADRDVEFRLGPDALVADALDGAARIVLSPGLSPLHEPVKSFLEQARRRDIEVIGEIELFARALNDMAGQGYTPRVLAVTGTNGKTTVTAMTRQLVQGCGLGVRAAGNISPAALTALAQALDAGTLPDVWVLELSSYQLETTFSLAPDAAVVLNLTQDHLDWHGSMQAYAAAKARLLALAKVAIVNRDDPSVVAMVDDVNGIAVRSFGAQAPVRQGDMGIEDSAGMAWLTASENTDFDMPAAPGRKRKQDGAPSRPAGRAVRLMPVEALRVRGAHNAMNALAALALVRQLGLNWAGMLPALRDYRGEPHRTEYVRTIAGVDFFNDSKGTNVGATVAALEGLGQTVVLIAGGLGKGQDFSPLADAVRRHVRAVVLIGRDGPLIARALAPSRVAVMTADTLDAAVATAYGQTQAGDAVLLSPACASLDMFDNYRHRGESFVLAVQELALEKGEVA
jgi:UDP-N-acetylmuramoylalanine--D-glutamate ligase